MVTASEHRDMAKGYGRKGLVYRASFLIMLATLSSRFLGLAKNVLLANYFGTQMVMDAFWIAIIVPMLFLQLFTSGMRNYVPIFTHELVRKGKKQAWDFGNHVVGFHFLLVIIAVGIGILFAPTLVRLIAPGATPAVKDLAATMSRMLMAITFFLGIAEIFAPVFYAQERFLLPALGGVVNNVVILGFLVFGHGRFGIFALVWGVVIGAILQLILLAPGLLRMRDRVTPKFKIKHPAVRQVVKLSVPAYFSQAGIYLNNFADKFFASMLPVGAISALSYAFMVVEIPSSVITLSLDRAVLPGLSARFGNKDKSHALRSISEWLGFLMVVLIPFTLIFLVLGKPILQVIFEHGSFDPSSTQRTWQALLFYSFGIPATAITALMGTAFIADKDTRTPVKLGLIRVAINIVLNAILVRRMGIAGLALATSLSGYCKLLLAKIAIEKRYPQADWRPFKDSFKKVAVAGTVFALALYGTWSYFQALFDLSSLGVRVGILFLSIGISTLLYLIVLFLMQQKDIRLVWQYVLNWKV